MRLADELDGVKGPFSGAVALLVSLFGFVWFKELTCRIGRYCERRTFSQQTESCIVLVASCEDMLESVYVAFRLLQSS